jgi:hypothetical protein
MSTRTFWVAVAVLALWTGFTVYMITRAGSDGEVLWTRLAWLFSSVEAVAFAAAGALFGSSVQRDRAEAAERRADKNADRASNGLALAKNLLADEPDTESGARALDAMSATNRDGATVIAKRHASLARSLFPDA